MCLSFYYHMYGADIGTLDVTMEHNAGAGHPVWKVSGEQGLDWKKAEIDITTDLISKV